MCFQKILKNILKKIKKSKVFSSEKKLLNGKDAANSSKQSIILFTTHKCASTFLKKLSCELSKHSGLINIDFSSYFLSQGKPIFLINESENKLLLESFKSKGYLFAPLRQFYNIPDLNQYKILLVLRDPRDVLASFYYSVAYSHSLAHESMVEERQIALGSNIDDYVLLYIADNFLSRYENYLNLLGRENVFFIKYEDMIYNSIEFLDKIQQYTDIKLPQNVINNILNNELILPKTENIHAHRRSGKPKGYKDKLKPETIEILNEKFKKVLDSFEFSD